MNCGSFSSIHNEKEKAIKGEIKKSLVNIAVIGLLVSADIGGTRYWEDREIDE